MHARREWTDGTFLGYWDLQLLVIIRWKELQSSYYSYYLRQLTKQWDEAMIVAYGWTSPAHISFNCECLSKRPYQNSAPPQVVCADHMSNPAVKSYLQASHCPPVQSIMARPVCCWSQPVRVRSICLLCLQLIISILRRVSSIQCRSKSCLLSRRLYTQPPNDIYALQYPRFCCNAFHILRSCDALAV